MPAPEIIHQLVQQFSDNRDAYISGRYNETQLRLEFLNPFFEALGWDMYNRNNYAPQNREVIHEDSIDIEGGTRAPDYCFPARTNAQILCGSQKAGRQYQIRYPSRLSIKAICLERAPATFDPD